MGVPFPPVLGQAKPSAAMGSPSHPLQGRGGPLPFHLVPSNRRFCPVPSHTLPSPRVHWAHPQVGGQGVPPQHIVAQAGAAQPEGERPLHKDGPCWTMPGQQLLLVRALGTCGWRRSWGPHPGTGDPIPPHKRPQHWGCHTQHQGAPSTSGSPKCLGPSHMPRSPTPHTESPCMPAFPQTQGSPPQTPVPLPKMPTWLP